MLDKHDIKLLLDLIANEQIHQLLKKKNFQESDKYVDLECLKTKLRKLGEE